MSTYTQIIYHLVYSTRDRRPVLDSERHEELFRYIWGVVNNRKGHLFRINGTADHIHILTSLHPAQSLSDFVKDIKLASSKWIKENAVFADFSGWQKGYGAFTHSVNDKNDLIEYIKSQKEHHRVRTFKEELIDLLNKAGIDYDLHYLDE